MNESIKSKSEKFSKILDYLKRELQVSQKKLQTILKDYGVNTSTASISNAKKAHKQLSTHLLSQILNASILFLEDVHSITFHEEAPYFLPKVSTKNKISLFDNTNWFLYYFTDNQYTDEQGISRALLCIKNTNDVRISNIKQNSNRSSNYKGHVKLDHSQQNLIVEMTTEPLQQRSLHLIFYIGNTESACELAVGQYVNIETIGNIVSGSVLIEKIDNVPANFIAKEYIKETESFLKDIPTDIASYFEHKCWNFHRSTKNILDKRNLKQFIKEHKNSNPCYNESLPSQKGTVLATSNYKYDLLIACPISNLPNKKMRNSMIKDLEQIVAATKKYCGFTNISYPKQVYFENKRKNIVLRNQVKAINESKHFLLIYPQKLSTSALVELGLALQTHTCIIFTKNGKELPSLIQKDTTSIKPNINLIIYDYTNIEAIIKDIKDNGVDLFL